MFSVQSKYSKKTKSISLLGFVISNKTCKTWNMQIRCQPSRLSSSSRWKPNSLLPMQKRPMDSSHHRCQIFTPFMAAMFLLVFWILFSGPWWSRLVAKHKVFGCWMFCWRSFGAAEFLDSCLRGLIVLVAHLVQVAVCFGQMSLTHFQIWVGGLVPRKWTFCWWTQLQFLSAPAVNLGIDREGTAKSQDGQQKGTLAHVKRLCWLAKRISGWGICVSPFVVCVCGFLCCWFAILHDHRCLRRCYFNCLLLM